MAGRINSMTSTRDEAKIPAPTFDGTEDITAFLRDFHEVAITNNQWDDD